MPETVDPFGTEGGAGLDADGEAALGRKDEAGLGTGTDPDTTGEPSVGWPLQPTATTVTRAPSSAHRRDWPLADLSMEPDASAVLALAK